MEIVLERIAKKNTYTIGRLYILPDDDVKRKMISGKNAGDKCSFEHTFNKKLLSQDTYFCDTLEPTWRNLKGVELKPEEVNSKYSRVSGKVARKIPGHTAIPEGTYHVFITMSQKFKKWLPYLMGVPNFFESTVRNESSSTLIMVVLSMFLSSLNSWNCSTMLGVASFFAIVIYMCCYN